MAADSERLTLLEIAEGLAGHPTPTDQHGTCWFCGGGLGHPSDGSGHAPRCPWVRRDDLVEGAATIDQLRARLAAAEARALRMHDHMVDTADWLRLEAEESGCSANVPDSGGRNECLHCIWNGVADDLVATATQAPEPQGADEHEGSA
jgi:hypothetical protein